MPADFSRPATPSHEKAETQKTLDHVASVLERLERINLAKARPSEKVAEWVAFARHRIEERTQ